MHVFLAGASGYIGSVVAEPLRGAGHELSGLARSDASAARLAAAGVRPVRGDFSDPSTLAAAARAADGATMGAYADALALDQQATARRAEEPLGWHPNRPDALAELEHGPYAGRT